MFRISEIRVEHTLDCVTDRKRPRISYSLESDVPGCGLKEAKICVGGWEIYTKDQIGVPYAGPALLPFCNYPVSVEVWSESGEHTIGETSFCTGRLDLPWDGKWISDLSYTYEDKTSPVPLTFRKIFAGRGAVKRAWVNATALGIYELKLNGKKVGNEYFAPGLTSYPNILQYSQWDVTGLLQESNELTAVVGGGWAAGRFTYDSVSKITTDHPAFLMELNIEYKDGAEERIVTDETWEVTREGNYRFGDFYDGEVYDARIRLDQISWKQADLFTPKVHPKLRARYTDPVTEHEVFEPVNIFRAKSGELIYDMGQNFAGILSLRIRGKEGQKIVAHHAEMLEKGELWTTDLRTAKAELQYICCEGEQTYQPRLTYMGFRYVGISGIDEADIQVKGIALYSDLEETGSFSCSSEDLNRLHSNVVWSAKSNFVDIPTDCPQRDERLGWTGDIALFAGTACHLFDMSRFFDKWLLDMKYEQGKKGDLPFVIPKQGSKTPTLATACWGDSCVLVPWAQYMASGDVSLLKRQYPVMKKFMDAAKRWAAFASVSKTQRRIWVRPFGFGDWCAPYGYTKDWLAKGKWVSTAYWAHSCDLMSRIAELLGEEADVIAYRTLFQEICEAYEKVFTDGKGKLKEEFQTGYVLPLAFHMVSGEKKKAMAEHLWRLVEEAGVHLNTGFTATPWLLFALADSGKAEEAYRLLFQETSPSWLYQVKRGGTTTWEQWDVIQTNGELKEASMNHYAYGAVAEFFFKRICGLEALEGGYRRFQVKPVPGGGLTWAQCSQKTPFGEIRVRWEMKKEEFVLSVDVPVSAVCEAVLLDGTKHVLSSGTHKLKAYIRET